MISSKLLLSAQNDDAQSAEKETISLQIVNIYMMMTDVLSKNKKKYWKM